FVLGQMQHKSSIPYLKTSLEDTDENEMVRHECAEALGSIAADECNGLLEKYVNDDKRVVRESCIIALDMCEYVYCFGQMQDEIANDILISVLENENQETMVRHEAAEALGAIASDKALLYLQKYKNDKVTEVAETCELALDRINWLKSVNETTLSVSPYNSVDPAPPAASKDINDLKRILTDDKINLFDRYRAMFALRNIGSEDAIQALGEALQCGSALFKHEVAFVLGQMQHKSSIPYLKTSLEDTDENEMVRHECAE
nr:nero [Cucujiformia]